MRLRLRAVSLAARSDLGLLPRQRSGSSPAIGLACDASVRRPGWQPACRRSDGAASADHLPSLQRRGGAGTLSVERGEKMGSLREGWASAALSSAIGAENRPLDVLVSVQQHACPCQPAMFAIGGRPPARCGSGRGVRSPPRAESPRASRATPRGGRPSPRAATGSIHPSARPPSRPRSPRTGAAVSGSAALPSPSGRLSRRRGRAQAWSASERRR